MTSFQEEIIENIRTKFNKVFAMYKTEKEKREETERHAKELEELVKIKEMELKEIKTKYNNLRLAKSILHQHEDSQDARVEINKIVREIDKCIALLNK